MFVLPQSGDKMMQLVATKDDLIDLENELFVRKESVKSDIQRTIQELIRSINEQKSKLMSEIDDFYDTVSVGRDRWVITIKPFVCHRCFQRLAG